MRNSLNRKLTFIFSGIVLVACLLLLGTCSWIFRSVESTVKNIRCNIVALLTERMNWNRYMATV